MHIHIGKRMFESANFAQLETAISNDDICTVKQLFSQSLNIPAENEVKSHLPTDELSQVLIPNDVISGLVAVKTTGDGNCLYNAISLAVAGN